MVRPTTHSRRRTARRALVGALAGLLTTVTLTTSGAPAQAGSSPASAPAAAAAAAAAGTNVVTPGDFTGYGFDQCLAPNQAQMDTWLQHSPFLSVGIYISGDSRACRSQPNLTPAWISAQLRQGWRLLPITLGPQASCLSRFPRYSDDFKISPEPGTNGKYGTARQMGRAEAVKAVEAARALGIVAGSTLWYDLEGYDNTNTHCRESALAFLSAWTYQLHQLDYISGVYSSAGSGILALDEARVNRPDAFNLPDQIWIARWDGVANTSTSYIREDGWRPHARVKQYRGGHDETWGGVTINIDSNFLDVGQGSVAAPEPHCDGVRVNFPDYVWLRPATATRVPDPTQVTALQCLLREKGGYGGHLNGRYNARLVAAVHSWQQSHGFTVRDAWTRRNWMSLHAVGPRPVQKFGSTGSGVRRLQRALNATGSQPSVVVTGVFDRRTDEAVRAWQQRNGFAASGVIATGGWTQLAAGNR